MQLQLQKMKLKRRVPANNCKQKPADDDFGKILKNNSDTKKFMVFCLNLTVPSQKGIGQFSRYGLSLECNCE